MSDNSNNSSTEFTYTYHRHHTGEIERNSNGDSKERYTIDETVNYHANSQNGVNVIHMGNNNNYRGQAHQITYNPNSGNSYSIPDEYHTSTSNTNKYSLLI
ncbi:hypothetical protein PVAND_016327 [Polypedilum vanderplanki]|uniref:Uncharacterized protein n=1 Tax=Polypedilum vanderplanki TaxID=319348 RepID=A0A9J6BFX7_POLVA|nr:hypothetical protein PVAND_016327 [Polypedilum vanderplanki]